MRNSIIITILILSCAFIVRANTIHIYPMFNGSSIVIDSLKIENLTKNRNKSITNSEQKDFFSLMIELGTSVKKNATIPIIFLKSNRPGSLNVGLFDTSTTQVDVKLYSIEGILISNIICPYSEELNISIPHNKVYIVTITTLNGMQSFKAIGSSQESSFNIYNGQGEQNVAVKSLSIENDEDYIVYEGDKLLVTGYVDGFFEQSLRYEVSGSDDILLNFEKSSVTDVDGNSYKTVKIGTQIWMAENLKTIHYPDKTSIPYIEDSETWANLMDNNSSDAYCYYNNNKDGEKNIYGALYTYAAAIGKNWIHQNKDYQGICPDGWHLPSDDDWNTLEIYLGLDPEDAFLAYRGDYVDKLKTETGWNNDGNGNNESGLSVLPGGYRRYDSGEFTNLGFYAHYWTRSIIDGGYVYVRYINYYPETVTRKSSNKKSNGYSVRCIKDTTIQILPSCNLVNILGIGDIYASFEGKIYYTGGESLTDYGVEISTNQSFPAASTFKVSAQMRKDYKFLANADGLNEKSYYYYRSYATNSIGTTYGNTFRFKTLGFNNFSTIAYNQMNFTFSGDAPWFIMDYDMGASGNNGKARSGIIDKGQTSSVSTQINGSGKISFEWSIDCGYRYSSDTLRFYVDDKLIKTFDFEDWSSRYEYINPDTGLHMYTWRFEKNISIFDETRGAGRLNDVVFTLSN